MLDELPEAAAAPVTPARAGAPRAVHENLRRIFTEAPAAIAILRAPDFRYELSNERNDWLAGGKRLEGLTIREALPELEAQGLVALLEQVCATGQPFYAQALPVQVRQADGHFKQLYLNGTYQPFTGEDGRVQGVIAFAYEVTDQVLARQRAEAAEASTALVANSVPQIIWTAGEAGQADFVNQRWYEYTGLSREEPFEAGRLRAMHPDDAAGAEAEWTRCLAAGRPYEGELRLRRGSDGSYRWHLVRCHPLQDATGRVVRWVGSSTDIDDRKREEEDSRFLAETSALLGAALDVQATLKTLAERAVPRLADWCLVDLVDGAEGAPRRLALANADPARVAEAEAFSRTHPLVPSASAGVMAVLRSGRAELYPEVTDALLGAVARDEVHLQALRAVGVCSVMVVPLTLRARTFGALTFVSLQNPRGSGRRFAARDLALAQALADRTAVAVENARLYRDAQAAVQLRDDFLSVAAHELRTPLTPLQLGLQSLQRSARRGLPPEQLDEKLGTLGRQVGRLERLVSSLLDVSRISEGRLALEPRELDLGAVARDVAERFAEQAAQLGSTLSVEGEASAPVHADPLRMDQVVVNLVSNALKFGEGRPVQLHLSQDASTVELRVRDEGLGIAPEDQERIFGRYERAVPSRHYGGLGLGLWLSRQLVEAMGGSIAVQSAPGQGATFRVRLPRATAP
ncbi:MULTISPECIES: ATP-binding protein [Myxococcaceae]|uniref:PAS domain-containing sensor histidine kinase n=1 Tax=Myxococcaceae TaxID=31 RepID=UPI00188F5059|nr:MULTISPECIES: ATP-binding protein [Myxococcaceae]MBF5042944.1 PAS domain-containing protein [Simulacricoccus sp. 17bor-14]